eukprot:gene11908-biopygen9060
MRLDPPSPQIAAARTATADSFTGAPLADGAPWAVCFLPPREGGAAASVLRQGLGG